MEEAQRQAALAVRLVHEGSTLSAALAAAAGHSQAVSDDGGRRRALIQELTYGTLRHWGTLDAITRKLAKKSFANPVLATLVAVAMYQLDHTRAPPFAVVDHAVNCAEKLARPAAKALVNALLRRYLREREALHDAVRSDPAARWSYPTWWIDRVRGEYPDNWQALLAAGNERPPLTLRVNRRAITREMLLAAFEAKGITATSAGSAGVIVDPPRPLLELSGFDEGWFAVQDLGAQLAAPLLDATAGTRVLDACAAPGGKTTHLAEACNLELVALDSDAPRLSRIRDNLQRLRLQSCGVQVIHADAAAAAEWWDGKPFARILLDAPCTASGVVRRHPDSKWLRRASDIGNFARQQTRLLDALWPCLAPDGLLLYVTCSIFHDENEAQMDAFCHRHNDALRETITFPEAAQHRGGQLLPSLPGAAHNQDGFFYALLRKA